MKSPIIDNKLDIGRLRENWDEVGAKTWFADDAPWMELIHAIPALLDAHEEQSRLLGEYNAMGCALERLKEERDRLVKALRKHEFGLTNMPWTEVRALLKDIK